MKVVYKACRNSILTLELLPDSVTNEDRNGISDPLHAKFRINKVKVISMIDPFTKETLNQDRSIYDIDFIYKTGEIVQTTFNDNINKVCGAGIHYFKTYETAVSWYVWYIQKKNIRPDGTVHGK